MVRGEGLLGRLDKQRQWRGRRKRESNNGWEGEIESSQDEDAVEGRRVRVDHLLVTQRPPLLVSREEDTTNSLLGFLEERRISLV